MNLGTKFLAGGIGAILGFVGAKVFLAHSAFILIPWGIAGVAIGYAMAKSVREAGSYGDYFGFVLAFVFMLAGYSGKDPVVSKIWFFAILGFVGAMFGVVTALIGYGLRVLVQRRT